MYAKNLSNKWIHLKGDPIIKHELIYYHQILEKIFNKKIDYTPRLLLNNKSGEKVQNRIGVGIGGNSTNWLDEYWIDLVKELVNLNFEVFIFGGKDSIKTAKKIEDKISSKINNFVGKLSIEESMSYIKTLDIFVGNDTGFTHFVSLFGGKTLIILGGGTFNSFFPWPSSTNQYLIYNKLECFNCFWKCKYDQRYCLTLIHPSDVMESLLKIGSELNAPQNINLNKNIIFNEHD